MVDSSLASEVLPEQEITSRVGELGEAIGADFSDRDPLFLVVLNGSVPFGADLVRAETLAKLNA